MKHLAIVALLLSASAAVAQQPQPTPDLLPQDIRVRFQTADLDNSGGLTQDEAVKGGFSSSTFTQVDQDHDGIVTVTEIAVYLSERAKEWSDADSDHDDTISAQEAQ